jgi:hypothetical protein
MGSSQFGLVILQTEVDVVIFGFASYTKSSSLETWEKNAYKFTE